MWLALFLSFIWALVAKWKRLTFSFVKAHVLWKEVNQSGGKYYLILCVYSFKQELLKIEKIRVVQKFRSLIYCLI